MLTIAIVGRPNVGKSTLFNRLAGKRLAIVDNTPGVTRDRRVAESDFGGLALRLIDTAGYEKAERGTLGEQMVDQTRAAIADADVAMFLIDAREGVLAGDEMIADALRRSGKPVILAANKSEGAASIFGNAEAHRLGFGEPITLSAEHAIGLSELYEALAPFAAEREAIEAEEEPPAPAGERPLLLAIVGRPNVGKSSLLNALIGEARVLVWAEPGVTRDAIGVEWRWQDRDIMLYDTAGLRRKARVQEKLEKLATGSTLNAIRFAECVVLVIDATQPFETQDLAIADLVEREGRSIVFVLNKWDLVHDRQGAFSSLRARVDSLLPQLAGAPLVGVSALTGESIERVMPAVMDAAKAWNTRVTTAQLNRFLADAVQKHPPPAVQGRRIRLRYITQAKARPPSFVLFGNQLASLPQSYLRYLVNGLRTVFRLPGTPIRFTLKTQKNPYAGD